MLYRIRLMSGEQTMYFRSFLPYAAAVFPAPASPALSSFLCSCSAEAPLSFGGSLLPNRSSLSTRGLNTQD